MRILDKYLSFEFLRGIVISLFVFVFIYVIVDFFEDISRFIDRKVSTEVVTLFYLYQIPSIVVLVIPVALLLSCFFSLGAMAKKYELVAMKASGMSLYRVALPIFWLALGVSLAVLLLNESLVPWANEAKSSLERLKIEKRAPLNYQYQRNLYYIGERGRIYYARVFDGRAGRLEDIHIYEFDERGSLVRRIDARKGLWGERGWVFFNGISRRFSPSGEEAIPFSELSLPQLEETPEDFSKEVKKPEEMNFFALRDFVRKLKRSGKDFSSPLVELYLKVSFPFANLIIVLLGAPLAADVRRSGMVLGLGLSLFVSFVYWGVLQISKAFGLKGSIPPYLAAWLPNFLFAAVGGAFFLRAKK